MPHAIESPTIIGKGFSASQTSLDQPGPSSPHILVIGGGVTACISSWKLLDKGYRVTMVAKEFATFTKAQRLTSQIGAALWEFPCPPCAPQAAPENLDRMRRWAMESYDIYTALAAEPELSTEFGVKLRNTVSFSPISFVEHESERERLIAIKQSGLKGFCHDHSLIEKYQIAQGEEKVVDAFQYVAPVIDTDQAMKFLQKLLQNKGAILRSDTLHGNIIQNEDAILQTYQANAIVNASGLGARELASDDSVIAARGGLLRVINDGKDFERIDHAIVVNKKEKKADFTKLRKKKKAAKEEKEECDVVFVVPRNDDTLMLGTFMELDEWTTDLTVESPVIKTMREKCEGFIPALKNARLDMNYPLAQGIRPLREEDARVERESKGTDSNCARSSVVHSYGHGNSGWTLAFGSALEVTSLVDEVLESKGCFRAGTE